MFDVKEFICILKLMKFKIVLNLIYNPVINDKWKNSKMSYSKWIYNKNCVNEIFVLCVYEMGCLFSLEEPNIKTKNNEYVN
jgi:hypothetical protein